MAIVSVSVTGDLGPLSARLAAAPARARDLNTKAVRKTAVDIASTAKSSAPVDTGYLRSSIRPGGGGGGDVAVGTVTPAANYASYVEHGTARMRARPFLAPAHARHAPAMAQALSQLGRIVLG